MIVEPHEPLPQDLHADVCVVGGGVAGITLARELADGPLTVLLVEEGGLRPAPSDRPVYELVPGPVVTLGTGAGKSFYLGGNSNHWFGNCRPLEDVDFRPREWVPHSGWPLSRDDLAEFYERAQRTAGLGDVALYDTEAARPRLSPHAPVLDADVLRTRVVQTTPEFSFATMHVDALRSAPNVTVLLGCHATAVVGDDGARARHVEVTRVDGARRPITADRFVLAAGGVENARLLLASDGVLEQMPAESADNVGRYFQEHWYYSIATPLTHGGSRRRGRPVRLYDGGAGDRASAVRTARQHVGGAHVWAQLSLAPDVAEERRLPGLALWLSSSATPPAGVRALKALLHEPVRPGRVLAALARLLRHPYLNAEYVVRKVVAPGRPSARLTLIAQVEQVPDPRNRVRLSGSLDRFGVPEAELHVELGTEERRGHALALSLAAGELGLDGRSLVREMEEKYQAGDFGYFWHHMGTTRMADDPAEGVVDRDGKVHGLENLFVTGSSTFPTSGTAGPTLTIVALAIRLADHLRGDAPRAAG